MVDEADLLAAPVPLDPHPGEPITLVFYSEDVLTNTKGLLVLCNGAGAVRAGQWARSVIINQGLGPGSMLSYIQWAISLGWAVVVLNPNDVHKQGKPVRQGGSYLEHAQTVWDHLLARAQAPIYIVAHSFGGTVITHLAESRADAFQDKVKSIAFTDSVHTAPSDPVVQAVFQDRAINFVSSSLPLGTAMKPAASCRRATAGTTSHEMTSHSAFEAVKHWFAGE
eukprot:m.227769 g.227769  ORF g.227769 m.227769 type:complete len:224 (-) comp18820_c0_seq2:271-942(-)